MKKRLWSLLLVVCMVLSLVSCNKKEEDPEDNKPRATQAVTDNQNEDNKGNGQGTQDPADVTEAPTPTPEVVVEDAYFSSMANTVLNSAEFEKITTNVEAGAEVTVEVEVKGMLKDQLQQILTMLEGKNISSMKAKLVFTFDQGTDKSGVGCTLVFNGVSVEAKLIMIGKDVYIAVPTLTDQYLKLDLAELMGETDLDAMFNMPEMKPESVEKLQKLAKQFMTDVVACAVPQDVQKSATVSVKAAELGLDIAVTGDNYIDAIDCKKAAELLEKYLKDVFTEMGMTDQISEIEDMFEDIDFDSEDAAYTIGRISNEDGSFAYTLNNNKGEQMKVVGNSKYIAVAGDFKNNEGDEVFLYIQKKNDKSGRIFLVSNNEVMDDFTLDYELLKDAIKLTVSAEPSEGLDLVMTLTVGKETFVATANISMSGEEIFVGKLSVNNKKYVEPSVDGATVSTNPEEWLQNFTVDKLNSIVMDAIGVPLETIMSLVGGSSGDDYDYDYDYDWDDEDYDWDNDDYDWDYDDSDDSSND